MPNSRPSAVAAAMPPIVAVSGPQPRQATINGSGARKKRRKETSVPEMIEANISAEAKPAASAIRRLEIISCPAPFERLEASAPTIGDRAIRKPYEKFESFIPGHRSVFAQMNPESRRSRYFAV